MPSGADAMLRGGAQFGAYRLLATLGMGGMATTYLAEHRQQPGLLVLKVMHAHLARRPAYRMMIHDEGRLVSGLRHPNLARVERCIEVDGRVALIMEFVQGCTLADLLVRRGSAEPLDVPLAIWITVEIAAGLHAAHQALNDAGVSLDIVHRDVSPDNVLLSVDGRVKLTDFGIAHSREARDRHGPIRGKLSYMSPEQATGRATDQRTDIYSLGLVLWEMLTGSRYFTAVSEDQLRAKVSAPAHVAPSSLRECIPPELDTIVELALEPNPTRRIKSARALGELLTVACPTAQPDHAPRLADLLHEHGLGDLVRAANRSSTRSHVVRRETTDTWSTEVSTLPPPSVPPSTGTASMPLRRSLIPALIAESELLERSGETHRATDQRRLDTLSQLGPRTAPALFEGDDDRHAFYLNAFIACARMAMTPRGSRQTDQWLDADAQFLLDGELVNLRAIDRKLADWRSAKQYVLVLHALLSNESDLLRGADLDARFEGAMSELLTAGKLATVDHDTSRLLLRRSAVPFSDDFIRLAVKSGLQGGLAALFATRVRNADDFLEAGEYDVTPFSQPERA